MSLNYELGGVSSFASYVTVHELTPLFLFSFNMPRTSKKLVGHIGFIFVRTSVRPCVTHFDVCHNLRTMHARIFKFHS